MRTVVDLNPIATGARSSSLYGSVLYENLFVATFVTQKHSVRPSGSAVATACAARTVAAPGLFSTMTGCG